MEVPAPHFEDRKTPLHGNGIPDAGTLNAFRSCLRQICFVAGALTTSISMAEPATGANLPRADAILEEVVVTATRSERIIRTNPYSVGFLDREQLTTNTEDQLADILSALPGLSVSDAGQAGQKRVLIRGEEARRMALLVDSQEFMDHREVGVPLLVDPNRIQRIEIVRGPASVLYGPKALAGVVNVITDRDVTHPFVADLSLTLNEATDGHNVSGQFYGELRNQTTWNIGAFDNEHGLRETPNGPVENTAYASAGANAGIGRAGQAHAWRIAYEQFRSEADVFVEPEVRFSPPFRDFAIDIPRRDRQKLRADYSFSPTGLAIESIALDVYHQVSDREFNTFTMMTLAPGLNLDTSILTSSDLVTDGINLHTNWNVSDTSSLVAGVQGTRDEVNQVRLRTALTNGVQSSREQISDTARLATAAAYLQADLEASEQLTITAGARSYRVTSKQLHTDGVRRDDVRDNHTIASVAAIYSLPGGHVVRATWSEGYIFPSLMNLAIGAYAGSSYINPAPGLSPETSETFELGYRTGNQSFFLDSVVFLSRSQDYIDHVPCAASDACPGVRERIYRNIGRADTHGLELNARLRGDVGQIDAGLTWLRRRQTYEGIDSYSSGVPDLMGHVSMTFERSLLNRPAQYVLTGRFESSSRELTATRSGTSLKTNPGHVVYDAEINWSPRAGVDVVLVAANLADRTYHSATQNLAAPGRHLRLRLNLSF
ncbi:MAG: TonB-dependent receptor [Proteobacteria bacterium]|nr:TonB-dependent receptor [Pseudomonadota bacterium]